MATTSSAPAWSALLAVQRAAHASVHVLSAQLADLRLSGSEINALAHLADGRGRTVSELAAAAGVRATTMTSVLDRLEQRGLVRRGGVPRDRRAVLVELTASGRQAADAVAEVIARLESRALAGLDAGTLDVLRTGLDALAVVTLSASRSGNPEASGEAPRASRSGNPEASGQAPRANRSGNPEASGEAP